MVFGINLAFLVGGTVVVENVFSIPGLGSLLVGAVSTRDYPVVQAVALVLAVFVLAVNLLTDVVHSVLDPRLAVAVDAVTRPRPRPAGATSGRLQPGARWLRVPLPKALRGRLLARPRPRRCCWSSPCSRSARRCSPRGRRPTSTPSARWSRPGPAATCSAPTSSAATCGPGVLYGGRYDLAIAFGATAVTLVVGTAIGMVAAYVGGWVEALVMRVVDLFFAFPFIVLVIAIVAALGPSLRNMFIALWVASWVGYARIAHGQTLSARRYGYVVAADCPGLLLGPRSSPGTSCRACCRSSSSSRWSTRSATCCSAPRSASSASGSAQPTPEWGSMISGGQNYLLSNWQLSLVPGIALVAARGGVQPARRRAGRPAEAEAVRPP